MLNSCVTVMKACSDANRIRILKILKEGELCVCQIVSVLGLGQSTVSKHLFLLKNAGLIKDQKIGRWVYYALNDNATTYNYVQDTLRMLSQWLDQDPQINADLIKSRSVRQSNPDGRCPDN